MEVCLYKNDILSMCVTIDCFCFQKWEDIVKEVKFLKQLKHENTIEFKGCFLKDSTCWVSKGHCDLYDVHSL